MLMATRLWQKENYAFDLANLKQTRGSFQFQSPSDPIVLWAKGRPKIDQRPQACLGCHSGCRARYKDTLGNEASCFATVFYWDAKSLDIQRLASNLINRYGLNAVELCFGLLYIRILQQTGRLKTAKITDCPLDFSKYGSKEFIEKFVKMLAYGNDGKGNEIQIVRDISDGFVMAAEKWGRRKEDLDSGILAFPYWGLPIHKEPRAQVYWGYATLLGDRDINEHDFDWLKWEASNAKSSGRDPSLPAEEVVKIITDKIVPFQGDLDIRLCNVSHNLLELKDFYLTGFFTVLNFDIDFTAELLPCSRTKGLFECFD